MFLFTSEGFFEKTLVSVSHEWTFSIKLIISEPRQARTGERSSPWPQRSSRPGKAQTRPFTASRRHQHTKRVLNTVPRFSTRPSRQTPLTVEVGMCLKYSLSPFWFKTLILQLMRGRLFVITRPLMTRKAAGHKYCGLFDLFPVLDSFTTTP